MFWSNLEWKKVGCSKIDHVGVWGGFNHFFQILLSKQAGSALRMHPLVLHGYGTALPPNGTVFARSTGRKKVVVAVTPHPSGWLPHTLWRTAPAIPSPPPYQGGRMCFPYEGRGAAPPQTPINFSPLILGTYSLHRKFGEDRLNRLEEYKIHRYISSPIVY